MNSKQALGYKIAAIFALSLHAANAQITAEYERSCVPCMKNSETEACDSFMKLIGSAEGNRKVYLLDTLVEYIDALENTSPSKLPIAEVFMKFWNPLLKSNSDFLNSSIAALSDSALNTSSRLLLLSSIEDILMRAKYSGDSIIRVSQFALMDSIAGEILTGDKFEYEYAYKFIYLDRLDDTIRTSSELYRYKIDSLISDKRIHGIYADGDGFVIAVGVDGIATRSSDYGHNWELINSPGKSTIVGVDFWNHSIGYLFDRNGKIYHTENRGANWSQFQGPQGGLNYGMKSLGPSSGIIFGFRIDGVNPIAVFTSSSGTWEPARAPVENDIYDIEILDGAMGLAVGTQGTILKTSNGGWDWKSITSGTENLIRSVKYSDANTAWAVGDRGTILKSADRGETWIPQPRFYVGDFTDIDFQDSLNGVLVGVPNTVFFTTDGGTKWIRESIELGSNLQKVRYIGPNKGIIATQRNHIIFFDELSASGIAPTNQYLKKGPEGLIDGSHRFLFQYYGIGGSLFDVLGRGYQ